MSVVQQLLEALRVRVRSFLSFLTSSRARYLANFQGEFVDCKCK